MLTLQFAISTKSMELFKLSLKEKTNFIRLSYFLIRSEDTRIAGAKQRHRTLIKIRKYGMN